MYAHIVLAFSVANKGLLAVVDVARLRLEESKTVVDITPLLAPKRGGGGIVGLTYLSFYPNEHSVKEDNTRNMFQVVCCSQIAVTKLHAELTCNQVIIGRAPNAIEFYELKRNSSKPTLTFLKKIAREGKVLKELTHDPSCRLICALYKDGIVEGFNMPDIFPYDPQEYWIKNKKADREEIKARRFGFKYEGEVSFCRLLHASRGPLAAVVGGKVYEMMVKGKQPIYGPGIAVSKYMHRPMNSPDKSRVVDEWKVKTEKLVDEIGYITAMAFYLDYDTGFFNIYAGTSEGTVVQYESTEKNPLFKWNVSGMRITKLIAWDKIVACCDSDMSVLLLDFSKRQVVGRHRVIGYKVTDLLFNKDENCLIILLDDGQMRIFDLKALKVKGLVRYGKLKCPAAVGIVQIDNLDDYQDAEEQSEEEGDDGGDDEEDAQESEEDNDEEEEEEDSPPPTRAAKRARRA